MDMDIEKGCSAKEEPCTINNNWSDPELAKLLFIIEQRKFPTGFLVTRLGHLLEPLLGHGRTASEITEKVRELRNDYISKIKEGLVCRHLHGEILAYLHDPDPESCRMYNNWYNPEIQDLFLTIEAKNLTKECLSVTQLGHLLEPLLEYGRTASEITERIRVGRNNYIKSVKWGVPKHTYGEVLVHFHDPEAEDIKVSPKQGTEKMKYVKEKVNLRKQLKFQLAFSRCVRYMKKQILEPAGVSVPPGYVEHMVKTIIKFRNNPASISQDNPHFTVASMINSVCENIDEEKGETTLTEEGDHSAKEQTDVLSTSVKELELTD